MTPPVRLPKLGLGTWEMGDDPARRADEVRALRTGLDLGLTLIDTAEMYGSGRAEDLVGEAIAGRRDEVVLVSKVLPRNATRDGTAKACERSLRRLRTDRLDLYLVHWRERTSRPAATGGPTTRTPGSHPRAPHVRAVSSDVDEAIAALDRLREQGKVRAFGVSNYDVDDLEEARRAPGGVRIAANQVYYNLLHRGIERRLVPWCVAHGVTVMAYTPLESGRMPVRPALARVAGRHGVPPMTVALAWTFRHPGVVTVVKTSREERVREHAAARDVALSAEDLADLDRDHPAPDRDVPLETV